MSTVRQVLQDARQRLAHLADTDPDLDARVLLCHLLGKPATWLYAWPDAELSPAQQTAFAALIEQRAHGTPVAHLTGRREFWGLDLRVDASTLIPRPDTELLVEIALELGGDHPDKKVLDLGTGTGAIALAIAHERPTWQITASDASASALSLAAENAAALGLALRLLPGHWFEALPSGEHFGLIVSNPPYVCDDDPHLSRGDVAHEPLSALTAGADGLADLRQIIAQAPDWLDNGGWLAVEHGWDQGAQTRQLFAAAGFSRIETRRDLGDQERVTLGQHRS